MDIEPTTMEGRKTLDLIQNNEVGNRNSATNNENVNKSTIFEFLYFWSVFFLSASFFFDLTAYLCYYQEKNNAYNYDSGTFIIRIITDSLFIAPLLIFIRYALTSNITNYIVGVIIFLPQLVLNLISVIKIFTQSFKDKGNTGNDQNINPVNPDEKQNITDLIYIFVSNITDNITNDNTTETSTTILTNNRMTILKLTPMINLIIYVITVFLTYLKLYKNF